MRNLKVQFLMALFFILVMAALPAFAAQYDFSSLGTASGGFKPQGNRLLVSDGFSQDGTSMFFNSGNETVSGMVIKPDGTNLASFDLGDLNIRSPFFDTTVSITITADLKAGGSTSQSVASYSLGAASTSLVAMGMDFSLFNDVTELRVDLTVHGSNVFWIDFDTINITDEQAPIIPGTTPTVQATNLTAASQGETTINIYWQNGDGSQRIVFVRQGNTGTPTISDFTTYTANADFSAAADIGGGWKCLYKGSGQVAAITGLTAGTGYRVVVYEFDGPAGGEAYLTTVGTNIINHSTSPTGLDKKNFGSLGTASGGFKPQGGRYLVSESFANDGTSMYYSSTNTTETGMVIKPNGTSLLSFDLVDLEFNPVGTGRIISVTVSADLKAGGTVSQTVTGFTMYYGIPYSLDLMGMDFSAFDDVTELRLDLTVQGSMVLWINFDNITVTDLDAYVAGTEPTVQATNLKVASARTDIINAYWQNGDGSSRIVFAREGNAGTPVVTDGAMYDANPNFSAATDIGDGWRCLYKGPERFVTVSGLTAGTEYRLVVYEFNGNLGGENYLLTTGTNIINHTTDPVNLAKYDFSGLGTASGGFKPQGNRFLVSDQFSQDGTRMYYNSGSETVTGMVIKPDGTNLLSLDLMDMEFSPFFADRTVSITITGDLSAGGTVSQTLSNFTMIADLPYSLALLGLDFSSFIDVTELRLDITVTGSIVAFLNFENITLNSWSVIYDGNGGTGGTVPTDSNMYLNGSTATVLGNTGGLTRIGYVFAGWNTVADGSGTSYAGGDTFVMGTSDVILFAQWATNVYTLSYSAGAGGYLTGNTYQMVGYGGDGSEVAAFPDPGFRFVQWSDGSPDNPRTDTYIVGNIAVTAVFEQVVSTFTLDYTAGDNGSITGDSHQTVNQGKDGSTVTALPDRGYRFVGWSDGDTTATRTDVNVQENIAVTAAFARIWAPDDDLPADLDLDGNGIPDREQDDIAVVHSEEGDIYFGFIIPGDIVIEYLEWIDDAIIADMDNRPDNFPLGLVRFQVLTAVEGAPLTLIIYCSRPIPEGAVWYKYDPARGWYDYSENAVISEDRMSLTLFFQDGGVGDVDGLVNGIIKDPSGPAVFYDDDDDDENGDGHHGGGGGGCFVQVLKF